MPRKRKINASTDEELMPPPQMPVPKKHKSAKQTTSSIVNNDSIISDITNLSNSSTQQTQNKCGPLSLIFEKAQQNESLHNKYFKELTNIYEKVCAARGANCLIIIFSFPLFCYSIWIVDDQP